jgi:ParB-like nuclease domain
LTALKAVPGERGALDMRLIKLGYREHRAIGDIWPLINSIRDTGLRHPVTISPGYGLITGRRRLAACQHLGWDEIPYRAVGTIPEVLPVIAEEDADPRQSLAMTYAERIYRDWQMREELEWWPRAGHNRGTSRTGRDRRTQLATAAGLNDSQYTRAYTVILAANGYRRAMNYLHPLEDETAVTIAREMAKLLETTEATSVIETAYARYRAMLPAVNQAPPATEAEVSSALAKLAGMAAGFAGMTLPAGVTAEQIEQWDKSMTEPIRTLMRFRRRVLRSAS